MTIRSGLRVVLLLALAAILLTPGGASVRAGTVIMHTAHHFQIDAPEGWYVFRDLNVSGGVADLLMTGSLDTAAGPVGGFLVVTPAARTLDGSPAEAEALLQEGIDNLSATAQGFRVLEPPTRLTSGENAAAKVVFWTAPSTYEVYQVLLVVTSAGWHRFWAVTGGMFIWDVSAIGPKVNASLDSFAVLPAPSPSTVAEPPPWTAWLLLGGIGATAIEGTLVGVLVLRHRRRGP